MMFYKSSILSIGIVLASILVPRGSANGNAMLLGNGYANATEIPSGDSNPATNPESLQISTRETFEPPVLVSSDSWSQIAIEPQSPATDLTAEVKPTDRIVSPTRSNFTPTPTGNIPEIRNAKLDPANTWAMAYVNPLSDVLVVNHPVVKPSENRIAQTPDSTPPIPESITPNPPATGTVPQTEPKKWSVGIHTQVSTTGFIGVDAGYKFSPNLHTRLGMNTVGFGYNYSSQGIDYNASLSPTNIHLLGDYFPFGGGLRMTGGFIFQNNRFSGSAKSNASNQININGTNYNASQIGTVETSGSFSNSVAPYLGIGFGTPINEGFGFNVDLGVMFAGSPTVSLAANNVSPSIPISIQNQLRSDLAAQQQKTNADIRSFNLYPVLSIGVSYAF